MNDLVQRFTEFLRFLEHSPLPDSIEYILKQKDINSFDHNQWNMLHWSCKRENGFPLIELLLFLGIDKGKRDNWNRTPLDVAKHFLPEIYGETGIPILENNSDFSDFSETSLITVFSDFFKKSIRNNNELKLLIQNKRKELLGIPSDFIGEISRNRLVLEENPFFQNDFSKVFRAKFDGFSVIAKVLSFNSYEKNLDEFCAKISVEIDLLRKCAHSHIALTYGICVDFDDKKEKEPFIALVMEDYPLGDLSTLIRESGTGLDGRLAVRLLEGVASGLAHLHSIGIVHGDVISKNIIIRKDNEGKIDALLSGVGLLFRSPEGASISHQKVKSNDENGGEKKLTPKVDSYAFGILAWEMNTGNDIGCGEPGKRPELPVPRDEIWAKIHELISDCFKENPEERPSAQELVLAFREII